MKCGGWGYQRWNAIIYNLARGQILFPFIRSNRQLLLQNIHMSTVADTLLQWGIDRHHLNRKSDTHRQTPSEQRHRYPSTYAIWTKRGTDTHRQTPSEQRQIPTDRHHLNKQRNWNLTLLVPSIHIPTVTDLLLHVSQWSLYMGPAKLNITPIQPVVVDGDGVLLVMTGGTF